MFSICENIVLQNPPIIYTQTVYLNPSNTELNPICHLLALLGAHHMHHVNRVGVKSDSPESKMNLKRTDIFERTANALF